MELLQNLMAGDYHALISLFTGFTRYLLPLVSFMILLRCARSLLTYQKEPELWANMIVDGERIPVTHWENTIGTLESCDICINDPQAAKLHAVLTRYDDGSWTIASASGALVLLNGNCVDRMEELHDGDVITAGETKLAFECLSTTEQELLRHHRTRAGRDVSAVLTLMLLTFLQLFSALQLILSSDTPHMMQIAGAFAVLSGMMWGLFFLMKLIRRHAFEVETIAFYLSTIGLSVIASDDPSELSKQLIAIAMGVLLFLCLGWALRDLARARVIRYLAAAVGIGLLLLNLLFGTEINGAKNWIYFGSISFQPSELVKVCFVFAGSATMERMVSRRNLWLFIAYTGVCCGCLALMNDFGSAMIFFAAFVIIALMRSGSFATIALICAGTGLAGGLAISFRPYAIRRFAAWRHVWEYALEGGYQQTRALMCIASGGLFGLGLGNGWLKYVAASDTDLVFAFVSEEWGLLVAIMMMLFVVLLAAFAVRAASMARSSFYAISACSAMSMLLVGAIFNVFGTLDYLPLTGVTFPFVSNGGSSMISAWGLLAFVKGADTRRGASFAIREPSRRALRKMSRLKEGSAV